MLGSPQNFFHYIHLEKYYKQHCKHTSHMCSDQLRSICSRRWPSSQQPFQPLRYQQQQHSQSAGYHAYPSQYHIP